MCGVRDLCGRLRMQNMYGDRRLERALQIGKMPSKGYAGRRFLDSVAKSVGGCVDA